MPVNKFANNYIYSKKENIITELKRNKNLQEHF